jgi:hypothetical protein
MWLSWPAVVVGQPGSNTSTQALTVKPRKDVDERLFLMHALHFLYDTFPIDSDSQALSKRIASFRQRVNELYSHIQRKDIEPRLTIVYADLLQLIDRYEKLRSECERIEQDATIREDADNTENGVSSFTTGLGIAGSLYQSGNAGGEASVLAGVVSMVATYLVRDYEARAQRDVATQHALDAAVQDFERSCSATIARTNELLIELAEYFGWTSGEVALTVSDGDRNARLEELVATGDFACVYDLLDAERRHRPRDPFAILTANIVKAQLPTANANTLVDSARDCVRAATLFPAGAFYNQYRSHALHVAGDLANSAWLLELKGKNFASGISRWAPGAVRIWDASLRFDPVDSSGILREGRAWALMATGSLDTSLEQAREVHPLRSDSLIYSYNMARLSSCLHRDDAIDHYEHAVRALGFNLIGAAHQDPNLAWMREHDAARYAAITCVSFEWRIIWGILTDDIVLTNKSQFKIENIVLEVDISSAGHKNWKETFSVQSLKPGESITLSTHITSRGEQTKTTATLKCDQELSSSPTGVAVSTN